jgi:replication-associated recombination protein RarA
MKFLRHLFSRNDPGFDNISGYDDIKDIVIRALDADENYNLLFIGPPASSKTLFLMGIQEIRKDAIYFDCSNTTSRILDVLQEERSKIILADEIDKLQKSYQNMLLNFMESGRVKVDQQKKQYDFVIK